MPHRTYVLYQRIKWNIYRDNLKKCVNRSRNRIGLWVSHDLTKIQTTENIDRPPKILLS